MPTRGLPARDVGGGSEYYGMGVTERDNREHRSRMKGACHHDYVPTLQGGDTYKCSKCGEEKDMTED